mgnify:CR=1 FL=1
MGNLIGKIKKDILGTNTFNVGFNNKSPVKGISRQASPLNVYTSSASFSGPGSATNTYGALMSSHYGSPVIPDNAEMGDVYAKAVGQVGKMSGQLERGWAPNTRKSSKKSVSRKSSSPLNQDDSETSTALSSDVSAKIDEQDYGTGGTDDALSGEPSEDDLKVDEDLTDQDKLLEFCTKNPNHSICKGRNTKTAFSDMNAVDRVNDLEWW